MVLIYGKVRCASGVDYNDNCDGNGEGTGDGNGYGTDGGFSDGNGIGDGVGNGVGILLDKSIGSSFVDTAYTDVMVFVKSRDVSVGVRGSGAAGWLVCVQSDGIGVSGCEINGLSDGEYVIGSFNCSDETGSKYLLESMSDGIKSDGDSIGVVMSFLKLFLGEGVLGSLRCSAKSVI